MCRSRHDPRHWAGWCYGDQSGEHGFLDTDGSFTLLEVPGAHDTTPTGINDRSQIVGVCFDAPCGFLYEDGVFTLLDIPGAATISANGINNSGLIVGNYRDSSNIAHGFLATPMKK
jgi:hypothetical protein